ncbi:K(+) efflux antiporter 6 isoform X3 [Solanum lycopersicum]|uniref:K(+) efflux antiporter 6 isoform X3 n=1 Tax=Solanum lycopersicum TaxID=4081 RepID=UPI0037488246
MTKVRFLVADSPNHRRLPPLLSPPVFEQNVNVKDLNVGWITSSRVHSGTHFPLSKTLTTFSLSNSAMPNPGFCFLLVISLCFFVLFSSADPISGDSENAVVVNAAEFNSSSLARSEEGSFANMIDRALEKEFNETEEQPGAIDHGSFNNSVAEQEAVLETVARVGRVKFKKNETNEEKSFQLHTVFNLDNDNGAEDTPTLIDRKDNVFIMSNPKSKFPVLQLDLRLISDLVVVIVSATCGGIAFACAGQPVITGYLLAGSTIGPGGLNIISEMVQKLQHFALLPVIITSGLKVFLGCHCFLAMIKHIIILMVETVAQFGVIFLLFALGLEFSTAKLRIVRAVAVLGGSLQIILFMCLCGITASVLKFLMERNSVNTLYGQVTVGILILQDCTVGLLFALLPILGGTSGVFQGMASMAKLLVVLLMFLTILSMLCRTCVPWFLRLMIGLSSQTNELYQLASVAFCLLVAGCSDKLGLSLELGSFAAGVMISTTDLAQHTLEQVEPIRNFFAALFLSSIGMLIHVHFLWNHIDILLAAVILVVIIKTIVVAAVVKGFGYTNKAALLVGMSLAQIGEFAFVLLSRASNVHLIEGKVYMLLLGTTALSLVTTPLLFKLIPAVVHLGVLLRWFSLDLPNEIGSKGDTMRADSSKRITVLIQGPHDS